MKPFCKNATRMKSRWWRACAAKEQELDSLRDMAKEMAASLRKKMEELRQGSRRVNAQERSDKRGGLELIRGGRGLLPISAMGRSHARV